MDRRATVKKRTSPMRTFACIAIFMNLCLSGKVSAQSVPGPYTAKDQVLVLCFHDVPRVVHDDKFAVDQRSFVETIEYLRTHGFHFVSVADLIAARENTKPLPEKPVLLTFDDAYRSYYDFVFPILRQYNYPSVLAVVTKWIEEKPSDVKQELMTWEQLREVAQSPLVEIATHTHNLHSGIVYNPQGNQAAAVTSRYYDAFSDRYEEETRYRQRIHADLSEARDALKTRLGIDPRIVVWPYGKYNQPAFKEAKDLGFEINFALNDHLASLGNWPVVNRFIVYKNPTLEDLLKFLKIKKTAPEQMRIMQVDLDLVYDPDPAQTEKNLSSLLDRVKAMRVGTVFLQAFADPRGTGNIESVYFPNRVLPMRADLFTRVAHQLKGRCQVSVYAWMPMLSIVLPDHKKTEELRVCSFKDNQIAPSRAWYERLSPFSPETAKLLSDLYEDLAIHVWLDGIVFQDDGYLNDFEDFHPDAIEEYKKITAGLMMAPEDLLPAQKEQWREVKTKQLIGLSEQLMDVVRRHDPEAKFARTLYAPVAVKPESEEWFAQDYEQSLRAYDYVVIMAYPRMEKVGFSERRWLKRLVDRAKELSSGMDKTIFKVQAYDWDKHEWIDSKKVNTWLKILIASGARHLAYYPDDYTIDQPKASTIRLMISQENFPFKRDYE